MSGIQSNTYNNITFALQRHAKEMAILQEQAYTGSRINRVSDDPSSAYQVLGLNTQQRSLANYMENISSLSGILEISTAVLDEMTSAISDTKALLTQIISGTYDESGRQIVAEQINDTLEQVVALANKKHLGQYIFGGSNTDSTPYLTQRTNGEITSITYQGGSLQRDIEVAPGIQSTVHYVGEDIFRSDDRTAPSFLGDTGAAAGTGTSSVRGDVWLTVTGSAGNYTLSLDGGTPVTGVDGSNANLALTDADGRVLYVDTTSIDSTGVEMVSVAGTYGIFDTLISVRDLLNNERGLSDAQLKQCRDRLADSLDEMTGLLVGITTSIGSKIGFIDDLKNSLDDMKFNTENETFMLQEADIAQVAIDISRREALYQLSLSVTGRLMSMSLLDFIR